MDTRVQKWLNDVFRRHFLIVCKIKKQAQLQLTITIRLELCRLSLELAKKSIRYRFVKKLVQMLIPNTNLKS